MAYLWHARHTLGALEQDDDNHSLSYFTAKSGGMLGRS